VKPNLVAPDLFRTPLHVVFEQRPDLDQVLRFPVLSHALASSPAEILVQRS
jgi:hypothetical protein